ncbi:MAG: endonuclease III domain-containing protein [Methanobacteriota archaeon]|nr:MAG: endonuclease III domain-containing protein [Euryarchaeota archaeon]
MGCHYLKDCVKFRAMAMALKRKLTSFYERLLQKHGKQGWWPLLSIGYHKGDYSIPRNAKEAYEICVGAILTQNTSWKNVEKALIKMDEVGLLDKKAILNASNEEIENAIRATGYYRQKARKLKEFTTFLQNNRGELTRDSLLGVWGIGEETADSIMLYAYKKAEFVVDSYTRRIMGEREGMFNSKMSYSSIKKLIEENLDKDYRLFQEYHALIVAEGKEQR